MTLWCYDKSKTKCTLPGAFLFFFFAFLVFFGFSLVCLTANSNATYLVPLQCPLGWLPAAGAPTHPLLSRRWSVRTQLSQEPWCWSLSTVVTQPLCFQIRADPLVLPLKREVCASRMLSCLFPPSHCPRGWARAGVCLGTGEVTALETSVLAEPLCVAGIQRLTSSIPKSYANSSGFWLVRFDALLWNKHVSFMHAI